MEKVDWRKREVLLASIWLASALIFVIEFVPLPWLSWLRVGLGFYLFFYPIGALTLKALKIEPGELLEHCLLAIAASLSLIVLLHLVLHLAIGLGLALHTSLGVISLTGLALYIIDRVRER